MKNLSTRLISCLSFAAPIAAAALIAAPTFGIVTMNSASADPKTDPYIVTGPVDVDDFVTQHNFNYPPIDPESVVQINIIREPQQPNGNCSASVINTPSGIAVLTAAHCVNFSSLKQIRTEIPVFGNPQTFETCHTVNDPGCDLNASVLTHPNYSGSVARGYDLALVFFDTSIPPLGVTRYDIAAENVQTDGWNAFVKFGYGCHGYSEIGVDECDTDNYDDKLRWAMNTWDSNSLGEFGVTVLNGQISFSNFSTQLVQDFDNYTDYDQNLFNYYGPSFDPRTAQPVSYPWCFGPCGILGAEGWSCAGDSGGPNFVYDTANNEWVIRAVNSYAFRMDDDWNGFVGNSDRDGFFPGCSATGRNLSSGEFGGDALVTPAMIDAILLNPRALPSGKAGFAADPKGLGLSPVKSSNSLSGW